MKAVLITGANRGIGLGLTKLFLSKGYCVHATYRCKDHATELFSLQDEYKGALCCYRCDVQDDEQINALVEALQDAGVQLDFLINNAGVMGDQKMRGLDRKDFEKVLAVNTVSPLILFDRIRPFLRKNSRALVVNISSLLGSIEKAPELQNRGYAYPASKAALNMITRLLADYYKNDQIAVISVSPGWVRTEMGGANATVSVEKSSLALVRLIESFDFSATGKFYHFDATELSW